MKSWWILELGQDDWSLRFDFEMGFEKTHYFDFYRVFRFWGFKILMGVVGFDCS